jgi:hypothetical protein
VGTTVSPSDTRPATRRGKRSQPLCCGRVSPGDNMIECMTDSKTDPHSPLTNQDERKRTPVQTSDTVYRENRKTAAASAANRLPSVFRLCRLHSDSKTAILFTENRRLPPTVYARLSAFTVSLFPSCMPPTPQRKPDRASDERPNSEQATSLIVCKPAHHEPTATVERAEEQSVVSLEDNGSTRVWHAQAVTRTDHQRGGGCA